ncbi:D-alanyl-D-alanine carboxypeptidase family protein [Bacillus alveayuensis]|uniref:serine-type D-Ala-D-Ala carboxypeptidase n=1 Tax=Aeribacillus alveayuensis TaxID=279215 RepID=A0ABT9VKH8_9BACI|nr:D-alanyl-D-alanine carboxypeptidase family protein [Bacillus alveayuensis]MDQ0161463.1 D-alanyl-D-alanine carboxypeptidase (penicillin-binding protein 5/6) [Bacillus alveayuensis]
MKRLLVMISAICMMFTVVINVHAEETNVQLVKDVKSAVLMERDTGQILYAHHADEKLPPASMTKIMTLLLIMEALDKGTIKLDEKVRASEHAASMGGSQIFLEAGEEMTVEDLIKGIAIASGNDASVAMAERIAGSEEGFVKMMNKKAKELGLKNTHFKNPTGLPEEGHYSSARDMAIMAKELLKYEDITKYTGKYEDYLRENTDKKFWLVNTNRLVKFYPGVDGVKTGYTNEAKYCLTATAKKGNMRVIAVVFGAQTPKHRNSQVTKMLDYAFSQYEIHSLYKRNEKVAPVELSKGRDQKVHLITSKPISILTKKGESIDDMKQEIVFKEQVIAPIKEGEELGMLVLKKGEKVMDEYPLVAEKDVEMASWWTLFKRILGDFTKAG